MLARNATLVPGVCVLIKTVTDYYVGRILSVNSAEILLTEAAWVPDTGRLSECLLRGSSVFVEIEMIPAWVVINRAAVTAIIAWMHPLPTETR